MPCIKCFFNQALTDENRRQLRNGLIDAVQLIPGKTADSVMIILEEKKDLYFHQSAEEKCAFVEVNLLLRKDPTEYFSPMSKKICELLDRELGIRGTDVYIRYLATPDWGWNGKNF